MLLFAGAAHAMPDVDSGRIDTLSRDSQWLRLLHYEAVGKSRYQSKVETAEFFLADDGATHPAHELAADLAAFAQPEPENLNDHARCRFPARWSWLKRQLAIDESTLPAVRCPAYTEWQQQASTDSVSLVLATGYLGNPASYYGHLLLKFNSQQHQSLLLDMAVNYGAIVPDNENPVVYVVKGIFGGYAGSFSSADFYHHHHLYGDTELRDLWEYRLDLSADEVALIVAHAWELQRQDFRYYFFRENCAWRMAELLEVIDGISLRPPHRPWTIPQSVIRKLAQEERDGRPLLADVVYHPSQQTRFYERFKLLSFHERRWAGRIVADPALLQSSAFLAEPIEVRAAVVDTLVDYTEMLREPDAAPDDPLSRQMQSLLAARFDLPPKPAPPVSKPSDPPERGRAPGVVRAGTLYNAEFGSGTALEFRGAYYDALDAGAGQVAHSALTMGDLRVAADTDDIRLQQLEFFRVDSVNGQASGLPGDRHSAWRVGVGLASQSLSCSDCVVMRLRGAGGGAFHLGNSVVAGVLFGGSLQNNRDGQGIVIAEATTFLDFLEYSRLRARIEHQYRYSVDGDLADEQRVAFESRLRLNSHWESRLRYEYDATSQTSLVIGWYW